MLDVRETPIKRLKKAKRYYSGKKKKHTINSQIIVASETKQVICTFFTPGKVHDFVVFKQSTTYFHTNTQVLVDGGYPGLERLRAKSTLPIKRSKHNILTK